MGKGHSRKTHPFILRLAGIEPGVVVSSRCLHFQVVFGTLASPRIQIQVTTRDQHRSHPTIGVIVDDIGRFGTAPRGQISVFVVDADSMPN